MVMDRRSLQPSYGVFRGVQAALLAFMESYRPGPEGVCAVEAVARVDLPIELWAWWSWMEHVLTASISAGNTDPVTLYTVPLDERCWLDSIILERASGDNDIDGIQLVWPDPYREGGDANGTELALLSTSAPALWWPDSGGVQANVDRMRPGPVLLEPGHLIRMTPGGAGVAASTFRAEICMRRTTVTRALVP